MATGSPLARGKPPLASSASSRLAPRPSARRVVGAQPQAASRPAYLGQRDLLVAGQMQHGRGLQHAHHAIDEGVLRFFLRLPVVLFAIEALGRGDGGLEHERAGHARDAGHDLGPVHQHFHVGLLAVGDALERDVRHDAADVLALAVGLHLVDEATGGAVRRVFQFRVVEACREQPLARERERDARRVDGDPAAAPLFGDVDGCAAAAGGVEDEVAGVGRHKNAPLNGLAWCLHYVQSVRSEPALDRVSPLGSDRRKWKVVQVHDETKRPPDCKQTPLSL
jgi:hypothetical protein